MWPYNTWSDPITPPKNAWHHTYTSIVNTASEFSEAEGRKEQKVKTKKQKRLKTQQILIARHQTYRLVQVIYSTQISTHNFSICHWPKLSHAASGEPPLLLAASVHCATREAIRSARAQLFSWTGSQSSPLTFQLEVPATMPVVKELCGLDNVERYLESLGSK